MEGKVAVVTGAAQSIGYAIAEALLKKGCKVCVLDCDAVEGQAAVKRLKAPYGQSKVLFIQCDVTSQDEMEGAFDRVKAEFGGLDIVCNNAGVSGPEDDWEQHIDVNLKGVIRGTRFAIEHMRKDKGGNGGIVLNMSSLAGLIPRPSLPSYSASKSGIITYTRSQAGNETLAANGLKFLTLCPSATATDLMYESIELLPDHAREPALQRTIEQEGILNPDELAEGAMQLLEPDVESGAVLLIGEKRGSVFQTFPDI